MLSKPQSSCRARTYTSTTHDPDLDLKLFAEAIQKNKATTRVIKLANILLRL